VKEVDSILDKPSLFVENICKYCISSGTAVQLAGAGGTWDR
jgi:hypothetical protein